MEFLHFTKTLYKWYKGEYDPYYYVPTTLAKDKKRKVIINFLLNRIEFFSLYLVAPFVYTIWYLFRYKIENKMYNYYIMYYTSNGGKSIGEYRELMQYNLKNLGSNTCIFKDVINSLNFIEKVLWYSGDIDPTNKSVPDNYHPKLPTYIRRLMYSAFRNPFYNYVWSKYVKGPIVKIEEVFDNRGTVETKNYGTGNHRVGCRFRVYSTPNKEYYFYYEHTYKSMWGLGYRTHYSGVVGISDVDVLYGYAYVWYESSNRPCKIITNN